MRSAQLIEPCPAMAMTGLTANLSMLTIASGGSWPGRAKESFELAAGNLTFVGAPRQDFRAHREGRLVAGTSSSQPRQTADLGRPRARFDGQLPGSAAKSHSRPSAAFRKALGNLAWACRRRSASRRGTRGPLRLDPATTCLQRTPAEGKAVRPYIQDS